MTRASALIVAILVGSAAPADALCYLCNRSDWEEQSAPRKHGFAMGVITEAITLLSEAPVTSRYRNDLASCVKNLGLTSTDLVDIIDQQYQDLANWEISPGHLLTQGVRRACLPHMNRVRAGRGEELLQ